MKSLHRFHSNDSEAHSTLDAI